MKEAFECEHQESQRGEPMGFLLFGTCVRIQHNTLSRIPEMKLTHSFSVCKIEFLQFNTIADLLNFEHVIVVQKAKKLE